MDKVRIKKSELLTAVKKNRENHRTIFLEALDGYKKEMTSRLESMLVDIRHGKRISHSISLPQPMDQTKEYDQAIKMLEMSVDEIIELDDESFRNLVMDDWRWKEQFSASNIAYSKTLQDAR